MGKKFGINTKAEEARERKAIQASIKAQEHAKKKEAAEAAYWSEGAHSNAKREAEEAKRLEKLARKREREELERKELESISSVSTRSLNTTPKPTQSAPSTLSPEIAIYRASNIDDALELMDAVTNQTDPATAGIEKHPERRMEAAYKRFEEEEMPKLKSEYPGLRHTQLKERLFKLWKKSPENPMNQLHISHRTTREQELHVLQGQNAAKLEQFRINNNQP